MIKLSRETKALTLREQDLQCGCELFHPSQLVRKRAHMTDWQSHLQTCADTEIQNDSN